MSGMFFGPHVVVKWYPQNCWHEVNMPPGPVSVTLGGKWNM
jgi:hypothetical protein